MDYKLLGKRLNIEVEARGDLLHLRTITPIKVIAVVNVAGLDDHMVEYVLERIVDSYWRGFNNGKDAGWAEHQVRLNNLLTKPYWEC